MKKLIVSIILSLILLAILAVPVTAADEKSIGASVSVNEVISLSLSDPSSDGIDFGNVDDDSTYNPDEDQGTAGYAIRLTVGSETNVDVDLEVRGTDFTGPGGSIAIGNAYWNTTDDTVTATPMTTAYVNVGSLSSGGGTIDLLHWLTIPDGTTAGSYGTSFYYQAIAQ